MITVTTSTGTKVTLENDGSRIVAAIAGTKISFAAVETATGFESRFLVPELHNTRATVVLFGDDLAASHQLFVELAVVIRAGADQDADIERRRQQILGAE